MSLEIESADVIRLVLQFLKVHYTPLLWTLALVRAPLQRRRRKPGLTSTGADTLRERVLAVRARAALHGSGLEINAACVDVGGWSRCRLEPG